MTRDEIEKRLTSPNLEIRKLFAENRSLSLTEEQIDRGLADESPIIRYIFAKRYGYDTTSRKNDDYTLTNKQMENGIKDVNPSVRALFIEISSNISSEDIDKYLKDTSFEVKTAITKNDVADIKLTHTQIETILSFKDRRVIAAFTKSASILAANQEKFALLLPGSGKEQKPLFLKLPISKYDKERGLLCQHSNIRKAYSEYFLASKYFIASKYFLAPRNSFSNFNYYQIERSLKDESDDVRSFFINQDYQFYTGKQINRVLQDKNIEIKRKLLRNKHIILTNEQINSILEEDIFDVTFAFTLTFDHFLTLRPLTDEQIELGLTSKHPAIRENFAHKDIPLTDEQIKRGLNDEDEYVRAEFVKRIDFKPNDAQIDYIIMNDADIVIITLLERDDITLKCGYINLLLKNKNPLIWQNVKRRKEYIDYQMVKETLRPETRTKKLICN